jgi:CDP-glucose 4,6-dehydratase
MSGARELGLYSGRRVLVTGHTGFKGAWLSFWLHGLGATVQGLALDPPSPRSLFEDAAIGEIVADRRLDVRRAGEVREAVAGFNPEIVFHLAAQSLVRPSFRDPLGTLGVNVMGTASVLDACRHSPATRAVVVVTSDKCYQNREWVWGYREDDPLGGRDPYSASKGCAELVAASYAASFFPARLYGRTHGTAVASARAGNVVGGGDWAADRLVPDCVRAFLAGETVRLRSPRAIRPWQHVLEPLLGYLVLGARLFEDGPAFAGGWNFAPLDRGDVWDVEQVTGHLCGLWGEGASYAVEDDPSSPETGLLGLDASKALARLGWRPRWGVAEALARAVGWYRGWSGDPGVPAVRGLLSGQIDDYVSGLAGAARPLHAGTGNV